MAEGLTEDQARAAYTLDRHVSVTAGPGAGKTTVLVERYLGILRSFRDVSVDQIVAITFTNRAANEMRTRLRAEIDSLMRSSESAERARWLRHKRTLDGAIITTIHGFCSRLLRQFPIEARVDPQFDLLDEHQTAMLEEAVAEEILTELISAGDDEIARLTVGVTRTRLVGALIEMYRTARNQAVDLDQLASRTNTTHLRPDLLRESFSELDDRMDEFIRSRYLTPAAEGKRVEAARRWPKLRELLRSAAEIGSSRTGEIAELSEHLREFREHCRPTKSGSAAKIIGALDRLIWTKDSWGLVPQSVFDIHARRYALKVVQTLKRLEVRLSEEKQRLAALDFDDLQIKALELLAQRAVRKRVAGGYRFYLVDEFQDTNGLQRDLLERLTLSGDSGGRRPNMFIVGDRKQSIYGFRGADVDVFRDMTERITDGGGEPVVLDFNFRSQLPLVEFFNLLFERVFEPDEPLPEEELHELGFVGHEEGRAIRGREDHATLIELLLDLRPEEQNVDRVDSASERDAKQVTKKIRDLLGRFCHRDIAVLFRAMTDVHVYEAELRRAAIPHLTVQGKGFYAREEVTDLIELLRFIDNRTDEIALAAVLRSPLCGLSDNALFALRCGPTAQGVPERGRLRRARGVRHLYYALRHHRRIDLIDDSEREIIEGARVFLDQVLSMRNRVTLADLLRFCIKDTQYRSVIAASFDGAARLANVDKLLVLAERFERSGANLVRDFVKFVADFEKAGGRESEGMIDESADAVRLMTVHQSKGLEFPVVIIPELHRQAEVEREWYLLDRRRGLTVKVPDERGGLVKGSLFLDFRRRAKLREQFESMRLLFVAATRARDRLILSGAGRDLKSLRHETWLWRICRALELEGADHSNLGTINTGRGVDVAIAVNSIDLPSRSASPVQRADSLTIDEVREADKRYDEPSPDVAEWFPLLRNLEPERGSAIHRFSVTQLVNYQRCPRQYYFDRVLHTPTGEELEWWNSAESSEPPANLTATLKGAVIHHFCDKYVDGEEPLARLTRAFDEVLRYREADLGERAVEIDREQAIAEIMPLAENYLSSDVRRRIDNARLAAHRESDLLGRAQPNGNQNDERSGQTHPIAGPGVFSEQRFRLRRPLGILTGTIDKLIANPSPGGGLDVEIVDFKSNRFRRGKGAASGDSAARSLQEERRSAAVRHPHDAQLAFGFADEASERPLIIQSEAEAAARDYRLQMQAYALAARELIPDLARIKVTLHFLDPNLEVGLDDELLDRAACAKAVDGAALEIVSPSGLSRFPVKPSDHCRNCGFRVLCSAGRRWLEHTA